MVSRLFPKTWICLVLILFCMVSLNFGQEPTPTNVAGGRGGSNFSDIQIPTGARILEVKVFAGEQVDAVQIIYELPDGRTVTGNRHGGPGGRSNSFRLDKDEYIIGISGRYGDQVDSISFRTNKRTSPAFGGRGGDRDYSIDVPNGNQAIGFMGRAGAYLDAVGLNYVPVNLRQVTESSIFGGNGGSAFSDREIPAGARISEIRVQAGDRIDAIQALYTLSDGRIQEGPRHGGGGGRRSVFRLDADEYVIGIYGRYGDSIDSITIRTNKRTSETFGGRGGSRDYRVDVPSGTMAIGFLGRSGAYLDAIGLVYERAASSPLRNIIRRFPGRRNQ